MHDIPDIIDLTTKEHIGKGAYSHVYKHDNGCIKVQNCYHPTAQNELRIAKKLKCLRHSCILEFYWSKIQNDQLITYMELGYMDLLNYVTGKGAMTKDLWTFTYKSLACALTFMHQNHLVHGDVKPENAVFTFDGRIVLCDFGFTVEADTQIDFFRRSGTKIYMAPEKYREFEIVSLEKCDIWSFGMTMFALCTCAHPYTEKAILYFFSEQKDDEFKQKGSCADRRQELLGEYFHAVRAPLIWDPTERYFMGFNELQAPNLNSFNLEDHLPCLPDGSYTLGI